MHVNQKRSTRRTKARLPACSLIQSEHQRQAADQVSISNSIGSLRFLSAMDWREFVETLSVVQQTLLEDPAGVYGRMEFATRDSYRHVIEKIAKHSDDSEADVAKKAIGLAREAESRLGSEAREGHVGFFVLCAFTSRVGTTTSASLHKDAEFAEKCETEASQLRQRIEQQAWDGAWYRRAYFDDGTPLGSASNTECRIDSISQSWSVLSGAGDPKRAREAMNAVDQHLVRREQGLIQLLDPPFDKAEPNPGYIKGYVPGVRENGGQYTHAAIWTVMAFAAMGDARRAWELFQLINPVNHANDADEMATYKVEPYVVAADVYSASPHTGRGGWTWYTGSAGWMYRLVVESLLGLRLEVDKLRLAPCLNPDWPGYKVHYRYRQTMYHINVIQTRSGETSLKVDGVEQSDTVIPLVDDHREHTAELRIELPQEEGCPAGGSGWRAEAHRSRPLALCGPPPTQGNRRIRRVFRQASAPGRTALRGSHS